MSKYVARKPTISTMGMPAELAWFLKPVKESIEMVTGVVGGELKGLKSDASNEEVIKKINEVIARINASGTAK